MSQRVIFNDNGTLSDVSVELGDFRTGSLTPAYTTAQDYIYIGSEFPFNHKWIDVGTVNAVASTITVEIWFGGAWVAAVDVLDGTKSGGASLARDGVIRWNTNRLKGWDPQQDSADVTGLTGTAIYDMYWVRLSWSATLTAGATLRYLGNKFCSDDELFSFYPALNNSDLMLQFEALKTDWDEQEFAASDALIMDLKSRGVIFSRAQVFDYELLSQAAVHKTAEIIYGGMGKAWAEQMATAGQRYEKALNVKYFNVDKDADGKVEPAEKVATTGWLTR